MKEITYYHNPRCSKSREGLALLEGRGATLRVVEYLKHPLKASEIQRLQKGLTNPATLVRTKEDAYDGFDLSDAALVAQKLAQHPILLERPIVTDGKRAVIGRPTERLLEIL